VPPDNPRRRTAAAAWRQVAAAVTADSAPEDRTGADVDGASPDASPTDATHRRRRTVATASAAATALVVGLIAAGATASPTPSGRGDDASGPGSDAAAGRAEPEPGAGCVAVPPPAADVDGDGCPEALAVQGHAVTAGDARWTLGEPGDLVTIGDWDCDGVASPAVLRPATGDVFVFPAWAPEGEPATVPAVRTVAGAAAVRAEHGDGCDRLVVEVAGGDPVVVDEARA
jgi:hypothetical protein